MEKMLAFSLGCTFLLSLNTRYILHTIIFRSVHSKPTPALGTRTLFLIVIFGCQLSDIEARSYLITNNRDS